MASVRACRAIQRSIGVGCSRVLNPRAWCRKTKAATSAIAQAEKTPIRNHRTASILPCDAPQNVNFSAELHQARRRGFDHLAEQTAVEIPVHRRRAKELRVIEGVERLPPELQRLRLRKS